MERPNEESQDTPQSRFSDEELRVIAEKVVKQIEVVHACPFTPQQVYFVQNFIELCRDIRSETLKLVIKFLILLVIALIVIVFASKIFPILPTVK